MVNAIYGMTIGKTGILDYLQAITIIGLALISILDYMYITGKYYRKDITSIIEYGYLIVFVASNYFAILSTIFGTGGSAVLFTNGTSVVSILSLFFILIFRLTIMLLPVLYIFNITPWAGYVIYKVWFILVVLSCLCIVAVICGYLIIIIGEARSMHGLQMPY